MGADNGADNVEIQYILHRQKFLKRKNNGYMARLINLTQGSKPTTRGHYTLLF